MDVFKRFSPLGASLSFLILASLILRGDNEASVLGLSCFLSLIFLINVFLQLQRRKKIQLTPLNLLLVLWFVWLCIPLSLGWVTNSAFFGLFQCSFWLFAFALFDSTESPQQLWSYVFYSLWFVGLSSALYALGQFFLYQQMPAGFLPNKNTTAALLMSICLLLSADFLSLRALQLKQKTFLFCYYLSLGLSLYLMLLTVFLVLSRGVLLSFLIFLTLFIGLGWQQLSKKRALLLIIIILLAFLTLLLAAMPALNHRLDLLHKEQSRLVLWQGAWQLWQSSAWYGLGIFNFMHAYPAFSLAGDGSNLQYAHNDFLQLLIETGIPGFLLLLGLMGLIIRAFYLYLKKTTVLSQERLRVIACFCALGSIAAHSFVDFNFYVVLLNLLCGCYLGYLHQAFKKEKVLAVFNLSLNFYSSLMLKLLFCLFLVLTGYSALRLALLSYYSKQTEIAIKESNFPLALQSSNKAILWFDYPDAHSRQADIYLQLASQAASEAKALSFSHQAEEELQLALAANPYYARPYLQLAFLDLLFFHNPRAALVHFNQALKNDPHFCLARLSLAHFLIDTGDLQEAQRVLEEGLNYPIPADKVEEYLNYLAKLRYENGNRKAALKVAERLEHLSPYDNDYSALSLQKIAFRKREELRHPITLSHFELIKYQC